MGDSFPSRFIGRRLMLILELAAALGCGDSDGGTGPAADYALELAPASLTIVRGATGSSTVTITRTNFTGPVTLSVESAPAGVTGTLNVAQPRGDPPTTTGTSATLTLIVRATVATGVHSLTVVGTGSPGTRSTPLTLTVVSTGAVARAIAVGGFHTCALDTAGRAYCWGASGSGQLGNGILLPHEGGFTENVFTPVAVSGGLSFSALEAGDTHNCGLVSSGSAYCWGGNLYGMLGNGGSGGAADRSTPVAVSGGLSFSSLALGGAFTCGLSGSGAAYCWGYNVAGQLGNGSSTNAHVPAAVSGGLHFTALSAGGYHVCGLVVDAAFCWGSNAWGQLGNSSSGDSISSPVAVSGPVRFTALAPGGTHTCGLTSTGAAYCWGLNTWGQLGTGFTANSSVPVAVAGGLTFSSLTAGWAYTCGVTNTGTAYCWGNNAFGQLGDASYTNRSTPVAVALGLSFDALDAKNAHTCGITRAGAVYCWGVGHLGQLGNDTGASGNVPVAVAWP